MLATKTDNQQDCSKHILQLNEHIISKDGF